MTGITVSRHAPSDLAALQRYLASAFHPKYILSDPAYLDWQYGGNLLLAKRGGEVVGHFGFRDIRYKLREQSESVRVLMNWNVLEPYRMAGVGPLLAQAVFEGGEHFLVSGYRPVAVQAFSRLRPYANAAWNLARFMAILDPQAPLVGTRRIPLLPLHAREAKLGVVSPRDPRALLAQGWDTAWERIRERYAVTGERSLDYLAWRFFDHPFFNYHFFILGDTRAPQGYLVSRMEEAEGFRIARVIDLISERGGEEALLRAFTREARGAGAHAADFFVSGTFDRKPLSASGFFETKRTAFEDFPMYFNPLSSRKGCINIWNNMGATFEEAYCTKADGDQDRPNPH